MPHNLQILLTENNPCSTWALANLIMLHFGIRKNLKNF